MPNRHVPGCDCCECWTSTSDFSITTSSVTGGLLFSDQMPTSPQWTSLYEPLDSVSAAAGSFVFGANATLTTGYRIDVTRATTSNSNVQKYTVELYNLDTSSIDATKEFYRFGTTSTVPRSLPVFLHVENCPGDPYTTTTDVVVGDVFCFQVEASGTYWGVDNTNGTYSEFGYGSRDRLLVAFNDDPCHLCGVVEDTFGGSSGVCVGDTLRVTISDLPTSSYSFSLGIPSTTHDISNISGNGTYNNAAKCPDCRYPNVLAEITYDESTDGGITTTSKTIPIYCLEKVYVQRRVPTLPVLPNSDIRLITPKPAFLDGFYTPNSDDGLGRRYQKTGLCKWEKFKKDVATYGNDFPEYMAKIVIEYV